MAKTKTLTQTTNAPSNPTSDSFDVLPALLVSAATLLHENSDPESALPLLERALAINPSSLPVLELLGEAHLDLGNEEASFTAYTSAAVIDPTGSSSGPEKFLYLAQLSPNGGSEAVEWYQKGVDVLKARINGAGSRDMSEERKKLVSALCGMVEIYMTDLCMEPDAEQNCERWATEALAYDSENPEALQTLASVRISQERMEEAVSALQRSWASWSGKEKEVEGKGKGKGKEAAVEEEGEKELPPFALRVGLARLLIETEQLDTAVEVLERLAEEDEQLPDLWYYGGWALFLLGEKEEGAQEDRKEELWSGARDWLENCLKLYTVLEWEDEGILQHATELLGAIGEVLPVAEETTDGEQEEEADEAEWDTSDDEDEEMKDA